MMSCYDTMRSYTPQGLVQVFAGRYKMERGRNKLVEIITVISNSEEVKNYVTGLQALCQMPVPESLLTIISDLAYFQREDPETKCLGGLAAILFWRSFADPKLMIYSSNEIVTLFADLIVASVINDKADNNIFFKKIFENMFCVNQHLN